MAKSVKAKSDASDDELARQKRKVEELLAQDRQKLLMKMPFVGALLMRLDLVPVRDERLATAATDGDRIYVDIAFYMKLKSEERLFVLAHEAWHCALIHFMRRQNRDKERFNIAADLEIHFILTDEGLKPPFVLPHDPNWKGLSAEEIYERLPKMAGKPGEGGLSENGKESANIKGQAPGQGFDKHLEKNDDGGETDEEPESGKGRDPDYSPEVKPGAEERCRERLTAAVQQYERTRGTLPAGIAGLVQAVLKPEIDWKELLAQFVTNCYGGSRRWLPPARRHVGRSACVRSSRWTRADRRVAISRSSSRS